MVSSSSSGERKIATRAITTPMAPAARMEVSTVLRMFSRSLAPRKRARMMLVPVEKPIKELISRLVTAEVALTEACAVVSASFPRTMMSMALNSSWIRLPMIKGIENRTMAEKSGAVVRSIRFFESSISHSSRKI